MPEPSSSNFPTSLDADATLFGDAVNLKQFTLNGSIDNTVTTIPVNESLTGTNTPCYLYVDTEIIYAASNDGTNFTSCVRAAGGSTADSHSSGASIYVVFAANYYNQLKRAIIAIETALGAPIVSGLTAKTTLADADTVGLADSAASNVFKKITWANFKTAIGTGLGGIIAALTAKAVPLGADSIVIVDSADSNASKEVLLSNLYKALGFGLAPGQGANLTIATGAIVPTHRWHKIDTEASAATDDLDTITATNAVAGDRLVLSSVASTRDPTVKDGTGNINGAGDFILSNIMDTITLMYDGSTWKEVGRSDNA